MNSEMLAEIKDVVISGIENNSVNGLNLEVKS